MLRSSERWAARSPSSFFAADGRGARAPRPPTMAGAPAHADGGAFPRTTTLGRGGRGAAAACARARGARAWRVEAVEALERAAATARPRRPRPRRPPRPRRRGRDARGPCDGCRRRPTSRSEWSTSLREVLCAGPLAPRRRRPWRVPGGVPGGPDRPRARWLRAARAAPAPPHARALGRLRHPAARLGAGRARSSKVWCKRRNDPGCASARVATNCRQKTTDGKTRCQCAEIRPGLPRRRGRGVRGAAGRLAKRKAGERRRRSSPTVARAVCRDRARQPARCLRAPPRALFPTKQLTHEALRGSRRAHYGSCTRRIHERARAIATLCSSPGAQPRAVRQRTRAQIAPRRRSIAAVAKRRVKTLGARPSRAAADAARPSRDACRARLGGALRRSTAQGAATRTRAARSGSRSRSVRDRRL